jgi:DNA-binding beta-propeller fold protein YncE
MKEHSSLSAPDCKGINHADFAIDGSYAIFTCEFTGKLVKIDMVNRKVLGYLDLSKKGMPQDIRSSPDGKTFYVADMMADGVYLIDGASFKQIGFIKTGVGTHACTRAATAPSCMSPTAAPTRCTVRAAARAACR